MSDLDIQRSESPFWGFFIRGHLSFHVKAVYDVRIFPESLKSLRSLMVTIRLSRGGAKKRPFYHVVVTDSRNKRDGRYIERLGFFNPVAQGMAQRLSLNEERVQYWLGHGAQTTDRVQSLIKEFRKSAA